MCKWALFLIRRGISLPHAPASAAQPSNQISLSAAGYMLQKHQDAGKVAHWLGNSPKILPSHYRQIVTDQGSDDFYKLLPF